MISFKDKIVVITGASRGIGAAAALRFAEAGASVVVNYLNSESAAYSIVKQIQSIGRPALAVRADVSKFDAAEFLVQATLSHFGKVDVLVGNAGIWEEAAIDKMTEADWDRTIDQNLKSIFNTCRAAIPVLLEQGSGNIVTVSSTAGQRGEAFHSHYAASKGGIISFTKALSSELGPRGISVNCVAPGWVDTDMAARALRNDVDIKPILDLIPLRRVATADDIAGPILFLASDLARHITGEILNVNGGSVLCG